MLRQRLALGMSYEEEDTCMSYKHLTPMLRQRLARGMSYEEEDTCMSYKHLDSYVAAAAGTWSQVLGCYYAHLEEVEKRVVPPFRKRPEDLDMRRRIHVI